MTDRFISRPALRNILGVPDLAIRMGIQIGAQIRLEPLYIREDGIEWVYRDTVIVKEPAGLEKRTTMEQTSDILQNLCPLGQNAQ